MLKRLRPELYLPLFGASKLDWYVDSVNGDDENSGKSPAQAKRTIAGLGKIASGAKIGLARGSHWREQLTITVDNVTVQAYGAGTKPLLDCSDAIEPQAWAKTEGRANIYQATVTTNYTPSEPPFNSVWTDGARLVRSADLDLCDATPGSYYVAEENTATPTLFVHPPESSNPSTDGKLYEYAARCSGFYSYDARKLTLRGIACRRNLSTGGSIKVGQFSLIIDCEALEGNKHSLYMRAGSRAINTRASKWYYSSFNDGMFVYNDNTPNGEGIAFIGCTADNGGSYQANSIAFAGHRNVSGSFGEVLVRDCKARDMGAVFSLKDATLARIENFQSEDASCKELCRNRCNTHIEGGAFASSIFQARAINPQAGGLEITAYGLIVDLHEAGQSVVVFVAQNDVELTLSGCDFTPHTGSYMLQCTGQGLKFSAAGNRFGAAYQHYRLNNAPQEISSDYNRFGAGGFYSGGTTYADLAAWQATGQDEHSSTQ